MSKAERLIEMMITINAKKYFTVGELANEFSVSKRTILRDLKALEQTGFPLYSEVGAAGGYHVLKERILPPIAFSENEAKALFFACQALQFYRDLPFEQETISALKKFLNYLPLDIQKSIMHIQNKIVFWIPDRHRSSPLLKKIFHSVTKQLSITIRYTSTNAESIRTIIPIGLYAMSGLWYCPAYCTKAKQIREFRVDRIQEIIEEKPYPIEQYPIPSSIQHYLENLEVGRDYHIKIKLTNIGVKRCETEFLLARGLKVLSTGDGMIDMKIQHSTLEWVADFLLSFGHNATVLEPLELVQLMKKKSEELYQHYCKS
ncbi:MAG: YafY family transcriptional regulator [Erysipelotrichaceae bacterium]|nr:YafY family transcriptional regulator [Erysipelotrichaceae bacterium]